MFKWLSISAIVYASLVGQTTIAPLLELGGIRPDWLMVATVFFALHQRPLEAVCLGWAIGFFADMTTIERMGFLSFSHAAAAFLVVCIRDYVFRYQSITQFAVTLFVCVVVHGVWLIPRWFWYGLPDGMIMTMVWDVLLLSLYSAVWAPLVHWILLKWSRVLGIQRPRYLYATSR